MKKIIPLTLVCILLVLCAGAATAVTNTTIGNENIQVPGIITAGTNLCLSTGICLSNATDREDVEDYAGAMVSNNTESLIVVTYDNATGTLDFEVTDTLSSYTNDAGLAYDSRVDAVNTTSNINGLFTPDLTVDNELTEEEVQDYSGGMASTGLTYDDAGNALIVDLGTSINSSELESGAVKDNAMDYSTVTLNDFTNDAGLAYDSRVDAVNTTSNINGLFVDDLTVDDFEADTNCSGDGSCSLIIYDSDTTSWDKDASNDVLVTTGFGGDVSGTYDAISLGSDVVQDNEMDYSTVTLNDFTNDAGLAYDSRVDAVNTTSNINSLFADDLNTDQVKSTEEVQDDAGAMAGTHLTYDDANNVTNVDESTIDAGNLGGSSGTSGQFLQTDGSSASWSNVATEKVKTISNDYTTNGETTVLLDGVYNPYKAWNVGTSVYTMGVYVIGDIAYMTEAFNGLTAVNVSSQTKLWNVGTTATALGVQVVNDVAYVAVSNGGLDAFNVSSQTKLWNVGTSGTAKKVYVVGDVAYVADDSAGLTAVNVSSQTKLWNVGTNNAAQGVQVVNDVAYVADDDAGLTAVNVSSQTKLWNVDTNNGAKEVQVVGDVAYVADNGAGLTAVNVSNQTKLWNVDTNNAAKEVQVVGDVAYVADDDAGLTVVYLPTIIEELTLSSSDTSSGKIIRVKDTTGQAGSSPVTINTEGSETIDGSSSTSLDTNYGSLQFQSDGTNWYTIGGYN